MRDGPPTGLRLDDGDDWREKLLLGAENPVRCRPRDEEALRNEEIETPKHKVGERVLDDILRDAAKPCPTVLGTFNPWWARFPAPPADGCVAC